MTPLLESDRWSYAFWGSREQRGIALMWHMKRGWKGRSHLRIPSRYRRPFPTRGRARVRALQPLRSFACRKVEQVRLQRAIERLRR